MKLWYLPFQPLEERYTKQWRRWFSEALEKYNIDYEIIDGDNSPPIKEGAFLDVKESHLWVLSQLKQIITRFDEIEDGDIIWVDDIEFPGMYDQLKFISLLKEKDVKLFGYLHACSVTEGDFVKRADKIMYERELLWLSSYDKIFVGSNYFRNKLLKKFGSLAEKVVVSGNLFNSNEIKLFSRDKENIIIFPHRFDQEKRPDFFIRLAENLKNKFPDWRFIMTTSRPTIRSTDSELEKLLKSQTAVEIYAGLSKAEYYSYLAKSKYMVSFSIDENFGYTVFESIALNTTPICPNNFSYKEFLPKDVLFNNYEECERMMTSILKGERKISFDAGKLLFWADHSADRLIEAIISGDKDEN